MDWNPSGSRSERSRTPAPGALYHLLLHRSGMVGKHRYGRCASSPDPPYLGDERRRSSGIVWRTTPHARASPTRLQECEVRRPAYGDRFNERLREGPGLGVARRRLCVVCRYLTPAFISLTKDLYQYSAWHYWKRCANRCRLDAPRAPPYPSLFFKKSKR